MEYKGFVDNLEEVSKNYSGKHKKLIKYLPSLFNLLCKIIQDNRSTWSTKLIVSSTLGYFVLPEDVIPDSDEEAGYLDDLFLVAFTLKQINISPDSDLIEKNWDGDEDIGRIIKQIYEETQDLLGSASEEIIGLVGLRKYILNKTEYDRISHSSKITKIMDEKIELIGLLSFVTAKLYGTPRSRRLDDLKDFVQRNENYPEIERIIQIAKDKSVSKTLNRLDEDTFSIERKLRRKRIKKLLETSHDIE